MYLMMTRIIEEQQHSSPKPRYGPSQHTIIGRVVSLARSCTVQILPSTTS